MVPNYMEIYTTKYHPEDGNPRPAEYKYQFTSIDGISSFKDLKIPQDCTTWESNPIIKNIYATTVVNAWTRYDQEAVVG